MEARTMNKTQKLPGLDLLRAIAIIWVMLFHALKYGTPSKDISIMGWMGVDLFFVLSGFLITNQLLTLVYKNKNFKISEFYLSRAFRILPAYLTVLAIYFLLPSAQEGHGLQPLWQFLSFTVNLLIDSRNSNTFSHVWSLCIEEHFYLVLPIVVLLFNNRSGTVKVIILASLIIGSGVYLRADIWLNELSWGQSYIEKIYYPTYTRLDGLLAGALLATLQVFKPSLWSLVMKHANIVLIIGILSLSIAIWIFKFRFSFMATVVGFPLLSFSLAFIVAAAASKNSIIGRFEMPGASIIATLAYSLYLTHKSVFHLIKINFPSLLEIGANGYIAFFVYAVAVFSVAVALYAIVERPFLKLRSKLLLSNKSKPKKLLEVSP
jgi:peptidoglycan/LPS O-acetylase OafA/YrhL